MAKGRKTGGRRAGTLNRATREIKELAGALVPHAYTQLGRLLKAKGTGETARLRAIEIVFERAFGKAPQAVKHSGSIGSYDLTKLSTHEIKQVVAILERATPERVEGGTGEA